MENENTEKKRTFYHCKSCDYHTCKKTDYTIHLATRKHKVSLIGNDLENVENEKTPFSQTYDCLCSAKYKTFSGLWKHRNKCLIYQESIKVPDISQEDDNPSDILDEEYYDKLNNSKSISGNELMAKSQDNVKDLTNLVMSLIQQNKELTQQIVELSKSSSINNGTINNTNNSNSHNKFNLNVFLNETCKDAMNMRDFIDSLQITVNDLEETGRLGYASGISRIFINGLRNLGEHYRPIHCSDYKREALYVKNNDEWVKDTEDKEHITLAIKEVANKNIKQIFEWQKMHPDYNDPDSKQNDKYQNILLNAMSGSTNEEANQNYNKIIKALAKEVIIDKTTKN